MLSPQEIQFLSEEIQWFESYLEYFFHTYFNLPTEEGEPAPQKKDPPTLQPQQGRYSLLLRRRRAQTEDRIILMLSLLPHIKPQVLDIFFTKNKDFDRGFSEFGGIQGKRHSGFIPTLETALFLLSAEDLSKRIQNVHRFRQDHWLFRTDVLEMDEGAQNEPLNTRVLNITPSYLDIFTTGTQRPPAFSADFPARLLTTHMTWEDLVLDPNTREQLLELEIWLNQGNRFIRRWNLEKKIKPGYRCLFYGPPGTGKTLSATLLGKRFRRHVYRVDLSMVISKYIGETEKNLEKLFIAGEAKNWILFFDEAEALFSKRTGVSSSNDRFGNQEVSYLLQRVEEYRGVVILATNLKANVDEAFSRRFQSMIHFGMPSPKERLTLWKNGLPSNRIHDALDFSAIANEFELSGGSIVNVLRYAVLMAIHHQRDKVQQEDILVGIRRELLKDGRKY